MIPSTEPWRIHARTVFSLGRSLSRFGPTTPLALAAFSVWHEPQVSRNFAAVVVAFGWVGAGGGSVGWRRSLLPRVTVFWSPPPPQPAQATQSTAARTP